MPVKILLVEPDKEQREQFLSAIKGSSFEVANITDTNEEAVGIYETVRPQLLVLKVVSGRLGASAALDKLRKKNRSIKAVASYDVNSTHLLMDAYSHGIAAAIKQPFGMRRIVEKLTFAVASERYEKLAGPVVKLEHTLQVRYRGAGLFSFSKIGFCERLGLSDMDLNIDKVIKLKTELKLELILPHPAPSMKFNGVIEDVQQTKPDNFHCLLTLKGLSIEERKAIEAFVVKAAKRM